MFRVFVAQIRDEEVNLHTNLHIVVVLSFLFVLGTKGRMQPVVMAPKNLHGSTHSLYKSLFSAINTQA